MQQYLHSAYMSCYSKALFVDFPLNAGFPSPCVVCRGFFFNISLISCVHSADSATTRRSRRSWMSSTITPASAKSWPKTWRRASAWSSTNTCRIWSRSAKGWGREGGREREGGSAPWCRESSQISSLLSSAPFWSQEVPAEFREQLQTPRKRESRATCVMYITHDRGDLLQQKYNVYICFHQG